MMPGDEIDNASSTSPVLDRALELMRAEVPVRAEWRDALLRDVEREATPSRFTEPDAELVAGRGAPFWLRTFSVKPLAAIAACLLAMAAGVAGTLTVMRTASDTEPVLLGQNNDTSQALIASTVANGTPRAEQRIMRFALVAPGATNVSIVGDFNNWNPSATPLRVTHDGRTWLVEMPLSAGRHVYAFVVDGDLVADPSAPRVVDHDFGSQNSVVLVGSS
jgi:hypothetical protein